MQVSLGNGENTLTVGSSSQYVTVKDASFDVGLLANNNGLVANSIDMYLGKYAANEDGSIAALQLTGNLGDANIAMQQGGSADENMMSMLIGAGSKTDTLLGNSTIDFGNGNNTLTVSNGVETATELAGAEFVFGSEGKHLVQVGSGLSVYEPQNTVLIEKATFDMGGSHDATLSIHAHGKMVRDQDSGTFVEQGSDVTLKNTGTDVSSGDMTSNSTSKFVVTLGSGNDTFTLDNSTESLGTLPENTRKTLVDVNLGEGVNTVLIKGNAEQGENIRVGGVISGDSVIELGDGNDSLQFRTDTGNGNYMRIESGATIHLGGGNDTLDVAPGHLENVTFNLGTGQDNFRFFRAAANAEGDSTTVGGNNLTVIAEEGGSFAEIGMDW